MKHRKNHSLLYLMQNLKKKPSKLSENCIISTRDPLHPSNLFPTYLENPELIIKWSKLLDESCDYLTSIFEEPQLNLDDIKNNCSNYIEQLQTICPISLPNMARVTIFFGFNLFKGLNKKYNYTLRSEFFNLLERHLKLSFFLLILYSKNEDSDDFTIESSVNNFNLILWRNLANEFFHYVDEHHKRFPTSLLKGTKLKFL